MKEADIDCPEPRTHDAAALVAAAVTVAHRRTTDEVVGIRCRVTGASGTRHGVLRAVVSGDTSFGALRAWAATEIEALNTGAPRTADEGSGVPSLESVFTETADGGLLLAEIRDPSDEPGWTARLRAALTAGTREPATVLSVLDLRPPDTADREAAVRGTGIPAEPARAIHEFVADQVAARPGAPAVTCGEETLTYGELWDRAAGVADTLHARGVVPHTIVGVLHRRSTDLIVALLGVLRAGAGYLALDPEDPPARHTELLAAAGSRHVLVQTGLGDRLPPEQSVIDVASCRRRVSDSRPRTLAPHPAAPLSPDALAYVSFTSGSTGRPKGVGVPHRAVSRLLRGPDWMEIGPDDVFLELAPVAFDASTIEIWAPLMNGARLVVLPGPPTAVEQIRPAVEREGVTVLLLTTGLFNHLVTEEPGLFERVRHVLTGGETASPAHVRRLLADTPSLIFTNGYGPTENTSFTTCWTTTGGPPEDERVPIGSPVRGTRIVVLDPALRPVPPGVVGELYTGGEGLARGYLGQPAATAERFVADPFAARPGLRLYRTGDLVRQLPDRTLEFVGRADQQVKVHGFRVEPAHVEAHLVDRPEVKEAVVVAQRDGSGSHRLLAYVVPRPGLAATASAEGDATAGLGARLREALAAGLPAHMVPWAIMVRDDLPLNRNGKVDRRTLPALLRSPRSLGTDPMLPRTALETRLAAVWSEVLDVEPVGVEDDFFELGGHSLLAARLLNELERRLSLSVPARALYEGRTIAHLARALSDPAGVPSGGTARPETV
ncbi:amino acid adenylation domain-containing protein [Streptomyces sp. NPDC013161]|uniref:amino acid adenylation domain-containing protein n=1 Tax=Streptomyces sp. NPDC013161 TaxID=3364862 RepID=UPI0036758B0C